MSETISDLEECEPGEAYRFYLIPQQYKQLQELLNKPTNIAYVRLKKAILDTIPCFRPHQELSKEARLKIIIDNVREIHGDILTLDEEYRNWVIKQKNTPFAHSSQYHQANICTEELHTIASEIRALELRLKKLLTQVPGGYKSAKKLEDTLRKE